MQLKNLPNDGICVLAGNIKKEKIRINPYDLIFKKIFGFSGMDVSLEKNLNLYTKKKKIKKIKKYL